MLRLPVCVFVCAVALAGCASAPNKHDPLEPMNRKIYAFNDVVDKAVLKPVAKVYVKVLPNFAQTGVSNFFSNIGMLVTTLNDALQLKGQQVPVDIMRFSVNTVFGIGGLFDIASEIGIAKNNEDFGQTLGFWGFKSGAYLVLPLLGPSSVRDAAGLPVDFLVSPYYETINDKGVRWGLLGLRIVDLRANLLSVDAILAQQLDPYSFVRDTYLQRREYLVNDGRPPAAQQSEGTPHKKSLLELEEEEFGDEPVRPGRKNSNPPPRQEGGTPSPAMPGDSEKAPTPSERGKKAPAPPEATDNAPAMPGDTETVPTPVEETEEPR